MNPFAINLYALAASVGWLIENPNWVAGLLTAATAFTLLVGLVQISQEEPEIGV
jgi:hypothetical protein